MRKYNYGDFDLSVAPCVHWWVRYAEFCQGGIEVVGSPRFDSRCPFKKDQSECPLYEPNEELPDVDNLPKGYNIY